MVLESAQLRPGEPRECVVPHRLLLDGPVDHNLGSENPLPCSFEERLARLLLDRRQLGFVLSSVEGFVEGLRVDTVLAENSDGGLQLLDFGDCLDGDCLG